mmetsp:Transcript_79351/g.157197  ORF Transcript_79351/g.157197 Transcript_79351/m.157197 type:complete len:458 (+) Transcript_79351:81-1454(+)
MGGCTGKTSPWHTTIPCEAKRDAWVISDWDWRAYVARTYTREVVQGVSGIDDVQLREELAMPLLPSTAAVQHHQHRGGGKQDREGEGAKEETHVAVGRGVRVGDGFITYGDVLLPQTQWEACEGSSWVLVSTSNTDGRTSSQHSGELVLIERTSEDEGVLCTATGKPAGKPQFLKSFEGKAFHLQGESSAAGSGTKCCSKADSGGEDDKCGDKDQPPKRSLWRCSRGGKAEVNVAGIGAVGGREEWLPCELHFHSSFSRLTVAAHGSGHKSSRTPVLVLERLLSLDEHNMRFQGVDLIFDPSMDTYWSLWHSSNAQEVVLHLARVDKQRLLLQLVYSVGLNTSMRPAALTVPVPLDQVRHLEPIVSRWQQFVRPLVFEDNVYATEEDFANAMASWLMLDMALSSANCAALLAGTGFAISSMDLKEGDEIPEGPDADATHQDVDADWFPSDLAVDAFF